MKTTAGPEAYPVRHLPHHCTAVFRFSLPLVPVLPQLLNPFGICNEKFFNFARFIFLCTQLLNLDI